MLSILICVGLYLKISAFFEIELLGGLTSMLCCDWKPVCGELISKLDVLLIADRAVVFIARQKLVAVG